MLPTRVTTLNIPEFFQSRSMKLLLGILVTTRCLESTRRLIKQIRFGIRFNLRILAPSIDSLALLFIHLNTTAQYLYAGTLSSSISSLNIYLSVFFIIYFFIFLFFILFYLVCFLIFYIYFICFFFLFLSNIYLFFFLSPIFYYIIIYFYFLLLNNRLK